MPAAGANATRSSCARDSRAIPSRPSTRSSRTSCAAVAICSFRWMRVHRKSYRLVWPSMVSDSALLPWYRSLREAVGVDRLFDVHTHLGSNDPDGFKCTREELTASLERIDAGAFVFPMHEPDGYPPANDMVIAEAEAAGGQLLAFCRLDPNDDPLAEVRRCLAAGARGIKLHPRAEGFNLDHPALADVFALADAESLPILVHAGRGIPALGRHAIEVCARHPGLRLILAHAGISDLAWLWPEGPAPPTRPAADPPARRHLRPGLDLDRGAGPPQPLLRHLLVVGHRHPGAVRAGAARPDPDGQRRALRDAGVRGHDGDAPRPASRSEQGGAAGRAGRPGAPPGRARGAAGPRSAPGRRLDLARPADAARVLVPGQRDRPGVRRRRPEGDAGAGRA